MKMRESKLTKLRKLDQSRRILEEVVRCERESVWEMNKCGQIERDQGNENRIVKSIYIDPQ